MAVEDLQAWNNANFVCGDKIRRHNQHFYNRRSVRCGGVIEANYYNLNTGTNGGRIFTKDICAICYVDADTVSPEEVIAKRDVGGKTPLPICR